MEINVLNKDGVCYRILMYLLNNHNDNLNYGLKISRKINMTQATIVKGERLLVNSGLVTLEKRGRKKYVKLTEKGKEIIEKLIEIERILNG